ncbi:aminotransferase class IV [Leucobacter sp. gxy201]|uniref:aminotransferase class IV n=1 Tax=Leucobacter sp. gxy201 TaxID=2957200 RepID=UPI003DA17C62
MTAATSAGELLVADSFRVRIDDASGRAEVRGFPLHLDRFRAGVVEAIGGAEAENAVGTDWFERVCDPFLASTPERISRGGAGFPRLELRTDRELEARRDAAPFALDLRVRPLPALGRRVDLVSAAFENARTPWVKGPNLARHTALNRTIGAEALLLGDAGEALEGATTAIVWWDDGALCVVESPSRVASVCEALITVIAEHAGVAVHRATIAPAQLAAHEVWALNALHGIRPVRTIDGVALRTPERARLAQYRRALEATWHPVLGEEF